MSYFLVATDKTFHLGGDAHLYSTKHSQVTAVAVGPGHFSSWEHAKQDSTVHHRAAFLTGLSLSHLPCMLSLQGAHRREDQQQAAVCPLPTYFLPTCIIPHQ